MNKIYIVNKSYYDNESGINWFFSTEELCNAKFDTLKNKYKSDDTFSDDSENSFSVDSISVVKYSADVDESPEKYPHD